MELQTENQILRMLKCDVKEVKTSSYRDVKVLKWSYAHRRGLSDTVLKDLKFQNILVF